MDSNRERFAKSPFLKGNSIRKLVTKICRMRYKIRKRTMNWGSSKELNVWATIVYSFSAVWALSARHTWLYGNVIPYF
jgi:hypothetical protein